MAFNSGLIEPQVHDALAMRSAAAPLLQLALMDARNRTLGWLSAFDGLVLSGSFDGFDPPFWLAAQAAWYQEYWIARHVQRARGDAADALAPRLASLLPQADAWFDPQTSTRAERWQAGGPDATVVRQYLAEGNAQSLFSAASAIATVQRKCGEAISGSETAARLDRLAAVVAAAQERARAAAAAAATDSPGPITQD